MSISKLDLSLKDGSYTNPSLFKKQWFSTIWFKMSPISYEDSWHFQNVSSYKFPGRFLYKNPLIKVVLLGPTTLAKICNFVISCSLKWAKTKESFSSLRSFLCKTTSFTPWTLFCILTRSLLEIWKSTAMNLPYLIYLCLFWLIKASFCSDCKATNF